jgi:cyclophilin family peptidyl-prolyl cis-trans isomerase/HEAT repeat protein
LILIAVVVIVGYFFYDTYYRERTPTEIMARIIHLEDLRAGTDRFAEFLIEPNAEIRVRAVLAIGRTADDKAADVLYPLLYDSTQLVAQPAAFALGLTGESGVAATLLVDGWDMPSAVTAEMVEAAGRLADSSMTDIGPALLSYFDHPAPEVREAACMALFRASVPGVGQPLVSLWRREQDEAVREAVLYVLARRNLSEGKEIFEASLADGDPYVRSLALRGMTAVNDDDARKYLEIALNDGNAHVVAQAVNGLARIGNKGSWEKLAARLFSDVDEKTTLELLTALRGLKEHGSLPQDRVMGLTLKFDSPYLHGAVLEYLADLHGDRAVSTIDSVARTNPPAPLLASCATAYGLIGTTGVISRLGELFAHNDPMVRVAAYNQLVTVDSSTIDYYINRALNDSDFVVQSHGVDAVKQGKRREYLPALHTMITSPEGVDIDVRRSILDAATAFVDETVRTDTALMEIFIAGILDPDYAVRRDAAAIYEEYLGEDRRRQVYPVRSVQLKESRIERALRAYRAENPSATIVTDRGDIEIDLYFDIAPLTVLNFIELAREGFYDGLIFHRVIPNFVAQGGDPRGDGWGGPAYLIRDEYSAETYARGTVGIATSGKDTGGSQFFICHTALPHLDGRYTILGQVAEGMAAVDEIARGDIIKAVLIHEGPQ